MVGSHCRWRRGVQGRWPYTEWVIYGGGVRARRVGGGVDVEGPGGHGEEAGDLRDRAGHARPDQARYRWVLAAVGPMNREEEEIARRWRRRRRTRQRRRCH